MTMAAGHGGGRGYRLMQRKAVVIFDDVCIKKDIQVKGNLHCAALQSVWEDVCVFVWARLCVLARDCVAA